ncbi:BsuPI-related putative proteinase inhibitor [Paraferrimonas sp. SM1919]|uniref:BsuPI-related putative proteinase inhibitor n=1 Tax=Paraferrimonas sp. SM1919 TaxID=2662263 RepID=UPI0013D48948|nr:BsuPI-related putative proteinase inhibitor [Paraferrimonas sp. SM1919]
MAVIIIKANNTDMEKCMLTKALRMFLFACATANGATLETTFKLTGLLKEANSVVSEYDSVSMQLQGLAPWREGLMQQIELKITNTSSKTLQLHFSSSKYYDLRIVAQDQTVWQWSDGRHFMQAVSQLSIASQDSISYWITLPKANALQLPETAEFYVYWFANPKNPDDFK